MTSLKRLHEVIEAVQYLRSSGLKVSVTYQTASGELLFEVDGSVLTTEQILILFDANELNRTGVHRFDPKTK